MRRAAIALCGVLAACGSGLDSTGFGDAGTEDVALTPDNNTAPDTSIQPTGPDEDADGLPDAWETAAGDPSRLSPLSADTDGDGVNDG